MRRFACIVVLCLSIFSSFGKDKELDSLLLSLQHCEEDTHKVNLYIAVARKYYDKSMYQEALQTADLLYQLATSLRYEKGRIVYFNLTGRIQKNLGDYPEAQHRYLKALKMSEALKDTESIAGSYNNLGNLFILLNRNKEAMHYLQQSLSLYKQIKNEKKMAYPLSNMAKIFVSEKEIDSAEVYFKRALKYAITYHDHYEVAQNYKRLTSIAIQRKQFKQALAYCDSALALSSKNNYQYLIGDMYDMKGKLFFEQKNYAQSRKAYEEGKAIYEQLGVKPSLVNSYKQLYKIDSLQGNFKSAFENLKLYQLYIDSISNTDKMVALEQQKNKFESERLVNRQQKEREQFVRNRNLLIGALLVILLFGIIFNYYNREKQKIKNRLSILETKQRISGDLHDEIGSALSSLNLQTEVLKSRIRKQQDVREQAEAISKTIGTTMSQVGDLVWSLNLDVRSIDDIMSRITSFCTLALAESDTAFEISSSNNANEVSIPPLTAKEVYLILKEGVNNAIKHAVASNIIIHCTYSNSFLEFTIKDDGKGFESSNAKLNLGGKGIKNIKRRTERISGVLDITSAHGKGCTLLLKVPA
ncbi:MAG: tetratricopeptide repeat protein [Chitinophagaceae bacterium]|nr:tetratricopeptide repeat protein [Chitinophagaceae bacterium]